MPGSPSPQLTPWRSAGTRGRAAKPDFGGGGGRLPGFAPLRAGRRASPRRSPAAGTRPPTGAVPGAAGSYLPGTGSGGEGKGWEGRGGGCAAAPAPAGKVWEAGAPPGAPSLDATGQRPGPPCQICPSAPHLLYRAVCGEGGNPAGGPHSPPPRRAKGAAAGQRVGRGGCYLSGCAGPSGRLLGGGARRVPSQSRPVSGSYPSSCHPAEVSRAVHAGCRLCTNFPLIPTAAPPPLAGPPR